MQGSDDKKSENYIAGKEIFIKKSQIVSLCLLEGHPSYMRSFQPSKENIHCFKT
jgi:hypothetical protein